MEVKTGEVLPEVNAAAVAEIIDRNKLVDSPNAVVLADGVVTAEEKKIEAKKRGERKTEAKKRGERKIESATPPEDDVCPICISSFSVPCRGNCGHWYCGNCILEYWKYAAISRPCKCPTCVRQITKLSPEASLQQCQEQEVKEVLAKVRRYNRLFVGGLTGFVQKLHELSILMRKMVWYMMDTDVNNLYIHEVRIFAMFLSTLYSAAEFNFIPTGGFRLVTVVDSTVVAMILILRLVGIYRRRRLAQQVRQLAAAVIEEPE